MTDPLLETRRRLSLARLLLRLPPAPAPITADAARGIAAALHLIQHLEADRDLRPQAAKWLLSAPRRLSDDENR